MSRKFRRRTYLKRAGTGVATVAGLAGCLGGGDGDGDGGGSDDSDGGATTGGTGDDTLNLGIISGVGGFGDQAFNDLALQGLERAAEEFGGNVETVESTDTGEYESLQDRLAQSTDPDYDLITLVSFYHGPALKKNADKHPDQNWMIINQGLFRENGEHFENVAGYIWANHQMSWQAGVCAGTMATREFEVFGNTTKPDVAKVGFVGGRDSNFINAFEEGYRGGVQWANPEVEVPAAYIGSFSDPAGGREIANAQINEQDVGIVYHVAAGSGPGVIKACAENDVYALGSDADQSKTLPKFSETIMGSGVKFINKGTYQVAKAVHNDNWGRVQGKHVPGLAEDGVAFVPGQDIGPKLPDVVMENVEESKRQIVEGETEVPCSEDGC